MSTVAIIDIDTTIANNDHRAILLKKKCTECQAEVGHGHRASCPLCGNGRVVIPQECWDEFLRPDLMLQDTIVDHALHVLNDFRAKGVDIFFLTGRNEKHREATSQWLEEHVAWKGRVLEPLVMRPAASANIPASVYKEEAFLKKIKPLFHDVTFLFFEDDPFVLPVWRKHGLVFRCPEAWELMNPDNNSETEPAWRR